MAYRKTMTAVSTMWANKFRAAGFSTAGCFDSVVAALQTDDDVTVKIKGANIKGANIL